MGLHTRLNSWCPRTKLSTSYVSAVLHSGLRFGCLLHFTRTQGTGSHLQRVTAGLETQLDATRVQCNLTKHTYVHMLHRSFSDPTTARRGAHASSFEFAKLKFRQIFFSEFVFAQFAKFYARQNFPLYGMFVYQSSGGPIIVGLHYIELCVL